MHVLYRVFLLSFFFDYFQSFFGFVILICSLMMFLVWNVYFLGIHLQNVLIRYMYNIVISIYQ